MTPVTATLRAIATSALDAALPASCVGCHVEGAPICRSCARTLDDRVDEPAGVPIGMPADIPPGLLQLDWCAPFHGVVRDALHAIKYAGEQRVAAPLGDAIARRWRRIGHGPDLVTHVPVHADRARQRGYDQADLIARSAARQLGLPHASVLVRQRATIAQFDLDRRTRATNVRGAFVLRDGATSVRGRWILLIDDVTTTGATLRACAVPLLEAGAIGVSAITVARER